MTELRRSLPPLPPRIKRLPVDARGYPVPFFVAWVQGLPEFRVVDEEKIRVCFLESRCWLCGEKLGSKRAFVVGPMCVVNRISAEPPSHRECAEFALRACPFLVMPGMRRREVDMPEDTYSTGTMIRRNPGVIALWVCKEYKPVREGEGVLFSMGEPLEVLWYSEGRRAGRQEVMEALASGLPALDSMCEDDADRAALAFARNQAAAFLPPIQVNP